MRLTRLVGTLTAVALTGLVPMTTAGPAHADDAPTTTTLDVLNPVVTYRGSTRPRLTATISRGPLAMPIYRTGTLTLFAKPAGSSSWTKVRTVAASEFVDLEEDAVTRNTQYYAAYSGGPSAAHGTFAPSDSDVVTVRVKRKVTVKVKGRTLSGKVAPGHAKKKVVVQKKVGSRWKKFRTVTTTSRSRLSLRLPTTRKKVVYRVTVPADRAYVKTSVTVTQKAS